jgi:hypothetical protein
MFPGLSIQTATVGGKGSGSEPVPLQTYSSFDTDSVKAMSTLTSSNLRTSISIFKLR